MKYILALFLVFSEQAFAITDYVCVSNCTSGGTMYGMCVKQCSTSDYKSNPYGGTSGNSQSTKQTDYVCVSNCTSQGGMYAICLDKCSF